MTVYVYIARCSVPAYFRFKRGEGKSTEKMIKKHFYKVGVAQSVDRRLCALQTGCPLVISLMTKLMMPSRMSALRLEFELHSRFHKNKTVGEWFSLTQQQEAALLHLSSVWPVSDPVQVIDADLQRQRMLRNEANNFYLRSVSNQ